MEHTSPKLSDDLMDRVNDCYRRWLAAKNVENQLVDERGMTAEMTSVMINRIRLLRELGHHLREVYAAGSEAEAIAKADECIRIMEEATATSEHNVRLWTAASN